MLTLSTLLDSISIISDSCPDELWLSTFCATMKNLVAPSLGFQMSSVHPADPFSAENTFPRRAAGCVGISSAEEVAAAPPSWRSASAIGLRSPARIWKAAPVEETGSSARWFGLVELRRWPHRQRDVEKTVALPFPQLVALH